MPLRAFPFAPSLAALADRRMSGSLVFPRWDAIAIIFSIFLLTYVYIEARSTYFRGSLLCFAYLTLLGGFVWAPSVSEPASPPHFHY